MKKKLVQRLAALSLAVLTALPLAGCGNGEPSGNVTQKEWIYVPEFVTIEDEEASYYGMQLAGDSVYYTVWEWDEAAGRGYSNFRRFSLTDRQTETISLAWPDGGAAVNINEFVIGSDGSIYIVAYEPVPVPDSDGIYDSVQQLYKFDAQGNMVYSENLSKRFEEDSDESNAYLRSLAADSQGRLYLCSESVIWLYDAEGKYQGEIPMDTASGWVNGMGCSKDGKVYINIYNYDSADGTGSGYQLSELDFEGKKLGNSYENFPNTNNNMLLPGVEKDFLVYDGSALYEYDLATQTKEEVLEWLDSDIDGSTVSACSALDDGRIVAAYQDWQNDDSGVVLLTKTKSSEVAQKETILIGTIYGGSDLQSAAVKFNKGSDKYHISIKRYMSDEYDDYANAMSDAFTNMNNDLTSRNCPDIIDLVGVNIAQMAAKGVFEDLAPYLDKSTVLNRSDLVESALKAYTYQDVLVSIPNNMNISTLVGSGKDLEGKQGWTVEEMIAYADAHPDAELFDTETKAAMMQYLMIYNESSFIDWTTGECKFDTDEFKNLLNFVNRFPDEYDWREDRPSTPTRIQNGEVLLDTVGIYDFDSIQVPIEEFKGEACFIGFPTVDGQSGHAIMASQAYAVTAKSKNKDGAWAFIESILTQEDNGRYWNGFPVVRSKLDAMIEEAMKVEYYENENGEMVAWEGGGSVGYEDGWSYTYHTTTQEEVDLVMGLIEAARPVSLDYGSEILNIISEEAEPFYKGQKSVDEVAGIIQSRIKIYVGENN